MRSDQSHGGSGRVSPSWEFPINIVGSTSYSLTVTTPDAPLFANGKCRIVVMSVNPPQIVRSMDQNAFRIGPLNEGIHRIQISCAAFGVGCLGGRSGQLETGSQNFQFTALLSRSGLTKDS